MLKTLSTFIFVAFVIVAVSTSAGADIIKLKNGQAHEGKVTAEEDKRVQFKLDSSGVRLWFMRDQIVSIENTDTDEEDEDSEDERAKSEEKASDFEDDATRARRLLEKMRKETSNATKPKKKHRTTFTKPPPKKVKKPKASPTISETEIERLISRLRNPSDIYARLRACKKLGQVGATQAIPDLIHALDDKSPLIRKAANDSLKKITGQDFAYDSSAQRSVRMWAIERWEKWYDAVNREEATEQLKSFF